jgi:hypothetical protein
VIEGQYQVLDKLSQGTFGQIYNGKNLMKVVGIVPEPVIIKFT